MTLGQKPLNTAKIKPCLMWAVLRAGYEVPRGYGIVEICKSKREAEFGAWAHGDKVLPVMVRPATKEET